MGKRLSGRLAAASGIALTMICAKPAMAQENAESSAALRAQIDQLTQREAAALKRVNDLEQRLGLIESQLLTNAEQSQIRGKNASSGLRPVRIGETVALYQDDTGAGGRGAPPVQGDRKTPAPTEAVEAVARDRQGNFGDRLSLEAGFNYSHFDDARINLNGFLALDAIFLGRISIDQVTADILAGDLTARYGVTDRLQVDANLPYLWRRSTFQSGGAGGSASGLIERTVTDSGIGDFNVGASYRLFKETLKRPDIVLSARVKAPTGRNPFGVALVQVAGSEGNLEIPESLSTGSGVWGASMGASILKTIDPMVLFGSLTYFHNFAHSFDDIDEAPGKQPGRAKVGDAIQYGAGVAFALNDKSSLSMSFTQRLVGKARLRRDGQAFQTIVGSQANVGLVNLGGTFAINNRLTLITTVGIGLTQDSPDMVVSIRAPFKF